MPQLHDLIPKLLRKTRENKLAWLSTATEGRYRADLDGIVVEIDEMTNSGMMIRVLNPSGHVVHQVSMDMLKGISAEAFSNLFLEVRRRALRVEETLSELEDKLDRL